MIMDALTLFGESVALAGAAGTLNIGSSIDTGAVARDLGVGKQQLWVNILVVTAPTGADTCQFHLVSDAIAVPDLSTRTVHYSTAAIAIASLPAGTFAMQIPLPKEGQVYERYLGVQQTNVGASSLASLVVDAWLSLDVPENRSYPDAAN